VGNSAPQSGLPDFGAQNESKSATADFDERAFAHAARREDLTDDATAARRDDRYCRLA
jgi:hypothetical protein